MTGEQTSGYDEPGEASGYDEHEYEDSLEPRHLIRRSDVVLKAGILMLGAGTSGLRVREIMRSVAHTVGIDAIMNMKGYNHHFGLERYPEVEAHNLGAQVPNERLIDYAVSVNADAILVSQIVTQKDVHVRNLTELIELLEAKGLRERFVVCAGGTRIGNKLAVELGYDAGFGPGPYPDHVATSVIERLAERAAARA